MSARATGFTVGIALDGRTATAVWRKGPTGAWQDATVACDAAPAGIEQAFAALAREVPTVDRVRVTLVRPLANARPVVRIGFHAVVTPADADTDAVPTREAPAIAEKLPPR